MAYPAYRPERRSKRRRWLLITLSSFVIVVLIALLVSRQTEQRGTVEFFGAAQEATVLLEPASGAFGEALASIGVVTRPDLTRRLESVVADTAQADAMLDIEAPSVIGVPYGMLRTASLSWMDGTAEVHRVILGIMDGLIVDTAVAELQNALDQVRVGDIAYTQFRASLSSVPEGTVIPDFATFRFIADDVQDPLRFNAANLVLRIQSAYSLAPHHDVSISGMTDPEPIGDRDGIPVVPFSDSLSVTALITNEGNEDEASVRVVLDVLNVDTGETFSLSDVTGEVLAGASTTVRFADLAIEQGSLYQVKLTATIPNDIEGENNVWEMKFIWNAAS